MGGVLSGGERRMTSWAGKSDRIGQPRPESGGHLHGAGWRAGRMGQLLGIGVLGKI